MSKLKTMRSKHFFTSLRIFLFLFLLSLTSAVPNNNKNYQQHNQRLLYANKTNNPAKSKFVESVFNNKNKNNNSNNKASSTLNTDYEEDDSFVVVNLSEFVARVKGGWKQAERIAKKFNLKLVKQVFEGSNYYLFHQELIDIKRGADLKKTEHKRIRRSLDEDEIKMLENEPTIEWIEEQKPKSRKKRDFIQYESETPTSNEQSDSHKFNDPMWFKLWYINPKEKFSNSMRITEAWNRGYTGKGVVVTILDDGLEWDHPDLIKNYDFRASLDINDSDNDPKPRYDRYNYNKHGTRCAGEIAAVADNHICSVGVAYNSHIGGIRMLDGEVTDLVEATALSYNRDYIDIYSASWGPDDDGKTVDGPGYLALKAIEDGIKYGRKGLGSIYVWASGNGGKDDDNCNCDGYTNSIFTISISSATQNGNIPWYSEACSSTIASTFSSGSYEERQIITTDLRKSCTEAHTGTSASAPLAAGIIALTLEANSELSWRDVQHIIVETSKPENLSSADWQMNGANRKVSHSFGYGMMDASAMIDLAKEWVSVPPQRKCVIETTHGHYQKPILIPKGDRLVIELFSTGCKGAKNEINFLEHVQAVISVQSNSRGTLVVYLRSPMGTNSTLLDRRMLDQSTESFNKWPFTSVHMWGEKATGVWTLEIKNNAKNTTYLNLNLILYGTKENPHKSAKNVNESPSLKNGEQPSLNLHGSIASSFVNLTNLDQRNKKAKQFLSILSTPKQNTQEDYFTHFNSIFQSNNHNSLDFHDFKNTKSKENVKKITSTLSPISSNPYLVVAVDSIDNESENTNEEEYDDGQLEETNDENESKEESNYNDDESAISNNSESDRNLKSQQLAASLVIPSKSLLNENQVSQGRSSLEYLSASKASQFNLFKSSFSKFFFLLINLLIIHFVFCL